MKKRTSPGTVLLLVSAVTVFFTACQNCPPSDQVMALLDISTDQLEHFKKLNYEKLGFHPAKFSYAAEYASFLISKAKIGKTTLYIEPMFNSYQVFEENSGDSLLYGVLETYFEKADITVKDRLLFDYLFFTDCDQMELWIKDGRKVFYIDNYYDPSINQSVNIVLIPLVDEYETDHEIVLSENEYGIENSYDTLKIHITRKEKLAELLDKTFPVIYFYVEGNPKTAKGVYLLGSAVPEDCDYFYPFDASGKILLIDDKILMGKVDPGSLGTYQTPVGHPWNP